MVKIRHMANTFRKIYKKTGNSGSSSDYELVGNIGVNGVELDVMKGATLESNREIGLVPKPPKITEEDELNGEWHAKYLASDGKWVEPTPFQTIWGDLYTNYCNLMDDEGDIDSNNTHTQDGRVLDQRIISQSVYNNTFYLNLCVYGNDDWRQILQFHFWGNGEDNGNMGLAVRARIWGKWSKWYNLT